MKNIRFLSFVLAITTLLLSACGAAAPTPAAPEAVVSAKAVAMPVAFVGIVDSITGDQWVISGTTVTVDPAIVRDGPFNVGDRVKVEGVTSSDGSLTLSRVEAPMAQATAASDDNSNDAAANANTNDANTNDDQGGSLNSNDDNSNASNSNDDQGGSVNSNDDNSNTASSNDDSNVNDDNSNTVSSNDDHGGNNNSNSNDDNSGSGGGNDNGSSGNDDNGNGG
jgi:hypothetical protein